jgi:hypothetical protein
MKLIESKTLVSTQSSIEFTSIPQDGTDLFILHSVRSTRSASADNARMSFNGVTTGFTTRYLYGTGSSVTSATDSVGSIETVNAATSTANTFSSLAIYIPNYTGATAKSFSVDGVTENNATESFQAPVAGLWSGTAAITSINFYSGLGFNYVAGSTISLYKITKGSDGIVTTS